MRQPTCHPRVEPLAEPNLDYRTLKKAVLENRRFLVVVVHQSDHGNRHRSLEGEAATMLWSAAGGLGRGGGKAADSCSREGAPH